MRSKRTPELIEALLIGLEEGKYENGLCKELDIDPSVVRTWKRGDADLREQVREARCDGILARLEIDKALLVAAVTRDEILKADKCLTHSRWEAEKLLTMAELCGFCCIDKNIFFIFWLRTRGGTPDFSPDLPYRWVHHPNPTPTPENKGVHQ